MAHTRYLELKCENWNVDKLTKGRTIGHTSYICFDYGVKAYLK